MKKSAILFLATFAPAAVFAAENRVMQLTLKDAIKSTIEKNLSLKAELYNPAQSESDIRKNRAIYETHATLNTSYYDSYNYSLNLGQDYTQSTLTITPGVYQLLPTGGTLNLAYQNVKQQNSTVAPFGSYWTSSLLLGLNQPLLKNFGRETTELNIKVSEISKSGSVSHLKSVVLAAVATVINEYYKLGGYYQDMESKKTSLELARKILAETEARVRAGVTPAMEILNAQFGLSSREKDLIDAEKAVKDQVDILIQLLQLDKGIEIVPVDAPSNAPYVIDMEESVRKALAGRPELEELQSQLTIAELQTRVSRHQTLPSLNLTANAGLTGLDDHFARNSERMASFDYPTWSVGLQLDYPIGNQSAQNDYVKNRLRSEQLGTQLANQRSLLETEVRTSIRTVQTAYKQLDVTDRALSYAGERLKAYLKKSEVGLATNKDVLDVENDLVTAKTNQIKALYSYAIAISQYWKSTGELLDREGITVDAAKSDALYQGANIK